MVFNQFFFKTTVRVALLFGTLLALANIFLRPDLFFTQIILVSVILIQIVDLTQLVNKTNYDLSRFLAAIKDGDFTINFAQYERAKSFSALHRSFSDLVETFREMETKNAAQFHFLNKLVDQIEFGILTLDAGDQIELINQHALNLLEIPKVKDWKKINNPNTDFVRRILELNPGGNQLLEAQIGDRSRYFSVNITEITIQEQFFRIASFQDIKSEIQQKEIEAWHKLIRILTHEIMNSVSPLVSLTETLQLLLSDDDGKLKQPEELDQENIEDMNLAVNTIRERSQGILKFVQDYRKLTRIPKPDFEMVNLLDVVNGSLLLMQSKLDEQNIQISLKVQATEINLDRALIDQVLINMLKNACESLQQTENARIDLGSIIKGDQLFLSISDNGPGIAPEKIDRIFVPFYTTKPDGSGIGLSVSRQIMNLHGGHLELKSEPGVKTTFSLVFPVK